MYVPTAIRNLFERELENPSEYKVLSVSHERNDYVGSTAYIAGDYSAVYGLLAYSVI